MLMMKYIAHLAEAIFVDMKNADDEKLLGKWNERVHTSWIPLNNFPQISLRMLKLLSFH